ncbi:CbiX/SirB N-terminal domain-containing protein [Zoogloea sp.]|uniref:sirohydrochlorin chelatase n=1 Tax=Zoogloea sp. TaxID=49181 RepID=UPI001416BF86|nr:MAG: cobalamin biosynthesis protein CbiX [Zoogloea sp.]
MSKEAIILFAHGARDPEWAKPAQRVAAALRSLRPETRVEVAFLEFMEPALADAVESAAASGASSIRVVPLFLAQGGHLKRDVPVLVEAARARHPGCRIELVAAVGEDEGVVQAMAAFAAGV